MSTENLRSKEAIDKLKDLIDTIDIGMVGSYPSNDEYIHAVPMSRQEVDDNGNVWFMLSAESDTYKYLEQNNKISVLFSDVKNYLFVNINGKATLSRDHARIEKYWNKMHEAWFEKGKEDPNIRILKVDPVEGNYWDNKTNKIVTFLKIAASAISGAKIDVGREGKLDL